MCEADEITPPMTKLPALTVLKTNFNFSGGWVMWKIFSFINKTKLKHRKLKMFQNYLLIKSPSSQGFSIQNVLVRG
jgi:hypothetical protein